MAPKEKTIDVIVCHYNKYQTSHIRYMALHAMAYLRKDSSPYLNILLIDGSPYPDKVLSEGLRPLGVEYHHIGRELSFGETYNTGIKKTSNPIVITMANDIFIESRQLLQLSDDIKDGVGCAMPYLTVSDFGAQKVRKMPVPRRCFPTRMTLNVNAFSRHALERVGLIPEEMTGCFNDVILYIRLREAAYSIVLRNVGQVIHLGQQTLKTGSSVSYERDAKLFSQGNPRYWHRDDVLYHKVAQCRATASIYAMIEYLPLKRINKQFLWNWAWAIEPYICAEPGTFKEGLRRLFRI